MGKKVYEYSAVSACCSGGEPTLTAYVGKGSEMYCFIILHFWELW